MPEFPHDAEPVFATRRERRTHEEAAASGRGRAPKWAERESASVTTRPARKRAGGVARSSSQRHPRVTRLGAKVALMVAAIGLVATTAVPAYARTDLPGIVEGRPAGAQSLAVGPVSDGPVMNDQYAARTTTAALASTTGSAVAPEAQAVAQQLMAAVAAGRLVGSTPDHIVEIRYLAQGRAVAGCGVDYRVLQTIAFALATFDRVGVSDINRRCTGQIEGAGVDSAHYADGGGHAVDFFLLDGHSLSGGDASSMRLLAALDPVVPAGTNVGQVECRASTSFEHFAQFADSCTHLHIDFRTAKAARLLI